MRNRDGGNNEINLWVLRLDYASEMNPHRRIAFRLMNMAKLIEARNNRGDLTRKFQDASNAVVKQQIANWTREVKKRTDWDEMIQATKTLALWRNHENAE